MDPASNHALTPRIGVLVVGMHRSGSSAVTRMLSLLGCGLPATPMPTAHDNPLGHWESQRVADFNDEILALAGTRWDDWLPVNPRLSETLVWPRLIARGRQVLREEFTDEPLFVLKDPRNCKLAGFWSQVLIAEGIDPVFVLPLRNPIEVARSLAARNGLDEFHAMLIWLRHVLAAEAATRGQPRVFTDYAMLLDNWEVLSSRLSEGLGVVWPRSSVLSASEISQFLTPDSRHYVSETMELASNPAISPWITKTYEVLLGWARCGEAPLDFEVLDEISREFDKASVAFARPMLTAARAVQVEAERAAIAGDRDGVARRLSEVEAELNELRVQRDTIAGEREKTSACLDEVQAQLSVTIERRDMLSRRVEEAQAELATAAGQFDALTGEHDQIGQHLHEVQAELAATIGQRDALADERGKVAWRLGEVEAELDQVRSREILAGAQMVELQAKLATAHAEIEKVKHCSAVTESTLRQREEEIFQLGSELKAALDEATREVQRLRDVATDCEAAQSAKVRDLEHNLVESRSSYHAAQEQAQRNAQLLTASAAALRDVETRLDTANSEAEKHRTRLDKCLTEITQLTQLQQSQKAEVDLQRGRAEWMQRHHALTSSFPQWWALMPAAWRRQREFRRFRRNGLFDADAYLTRYPDVAADGMDPLRHYIIHGLAEGRTWQ